MDLLLIKTDSIGNQVWSRTFGDTADDEGYSVQQTSDGGYIVAGFTSDNGRGGNGVWLIKADASGGRVWDRIFGGTGDYEDYSVRQTSDGGYIIAGSTDFSGGGDVWLIKTDADGN
jgi:hypothetical protein